MEHQVIPGGEPVSGPVAAPVELRVVAATSTRLPIGPRPEAGDSRPRSRYLLISHPTRGLTLVDSGVGPAMVPSRGRGLNALGLLTPWDLLAAIEVSPGQISAVVLTGTEAERVSSLSRLPAGIPVLADARAVAQMRGGALARVTGRDRGAHLGRALEQLRPADTLPRSQWHGVEGFDLFEDGSCLLIPLSDRPSGHMALMMPRVERVPDPMLWLTRPDLRITGDAGAKALTALPREIRRLMKLGARVMHAADPEPTDIDVIEV